MVLGQGLEPRLTGPKPAVLPLDDPRVEEEVGFEPTVGYEPTAV